MRFDQRKKYVVFSIIVIAIFPGCSSLTGSKPVVVMVRDAETHQPIAAANVRIADPLTQMNIKPRDPSIPTKADGVARLSAVPNGKHPVMIEVGANGYHGESVLLPDSAIEKIEPVGWFERSDSRKPNFFVDLFSGDPFKIELKIPVGFRGIIKAEVQLRDDMSCPPGQRLFEVVVSPGGDAQVIGPAILRRITGANYTARYADGKPVELRMDATKVGFRWVKSDGNREYFVVGTQKEYDMVLQQLSPDMQEDKPAPRSSGGGGGGKGGRGGGGGGRGGGGGMGGGGNGVGGAGFGNSF